MRNSCVFLLETLLFMGIVLVFGYYKQNPAFVGVDSHPFYLLILLIVTRHGYLKGLLSTLLLAAAYMGYAAVREGTPSPVSGLEFFKTPLSFFAFSMFVGLLVEADKRKVLSAVAGITKIRSKLEERTKEIQAVLGINENLSNQLTTSDQSFNLVFNKTRDLYHEDILVFYERAYDLLKKTVRGESVYVFYLDENLFKPVFPKEDLKGASEFLQKNMEHVDRVRKNQEFFSIDSLPVASKTTPVFIGPVNHEMTNTLYGILVVMEMDFIHYNESTFLTFKSLCKWLGEILYFRGRQHGTINPEGETHLNFPYIAHYGSSRAIIREQIKRCFEDYKTV